MAGHVGKGCGSGTQARGGKLQRHRRFLDAASGGQRAEVRDEGEQCVGRDRGGSGTGGWEVIPRALTERIGQWLEGRPEPGEAPPKKVSPIFLL